MSRMSRKRCGKRAISLTEDCETYIHTLLLRGISLGASDIHLTELSEPVFRVDGDLTRVKDADTIDISDLNRFLQKYILAGYKGQDGDFSFTFGGRRWRGNFFFSNGKKLSMALRMLPYDVPDIESLHLPDSFKKVVDMKNGIVLVTGPTGSGKSTTIAAMIRLVLNKRSVHLITIENPVEYLFKGTDRSLVNQREVGTDTREISEALKYSLRQDPDVILVGEIRDVDTARLAVSASETGHLVFATLHTVNAVETVNRLCGLFPSSERGLVQHQIASVLNLVVAQSLVKKPGGGRRAVVEALFPNDMIRTLIREGRTHEMPQYFHEAEYINTTDAVVNEMVVLQKQEDHRKTERRTAITHVVGIKDKRKNGDRRKKGVLTV